MATLPSAECPFDLPELQATLIEQDGYDGFSDRAVQCRTCGFGFLFELLEDFYPAPTTGFVVCDADARVIASGRGVFELTGFREHDLLGRDVIEALALSDAAPLGVVREWGVRQLGRELTIRTRSASEKPVLVDLFPAYDDDGGVLVGLTPRS